jgi:DNA-binding CsgD family transcriptional regulator
MSRRIAQVLNGLETADTPERIGDALGRLRDLCGVEQATFIARVHDHVDVAPTGGGLAGLDAVWRRRRGWFSVAAIGSDWAQRYEGSGYQHIDPVILTAFGRFYAFDWRELDPSTPSARAFRAEATAYGVGRRGLTVPLHGATGCDAAFSVISDIEPEAWDRIVAEHIGDFLMIAAGLQQRAHALLDIPISWTTAELDHPERKALAGLAAGRGIAEIAQDLDLTGAELRRHLANARMRLGARNLAQTVATALRIGLLH